jgi:nitrogen fixation protein FixH
MKRVRLFPGIVFGLLGLNASIVAATVYLAHSDRSFAVEPAYDEKAMRWDETARARERSEALGWESSVHAAVAGPSTRLTVLLTARDGAPVEGASVVAVAFASARASQRYRLELAASGPGRYEAALPSPRTGLWQVQVKASREGEVFVRDCSIELIGGIP